LILAPFIVSPTGCSTKASAIAKVLADAPCEALTKAIAEAMGKRIIGGAIDEAAGAALGLADWQQNSTRMLFARASNSLLILAVYEVGSSQPVRWTVGVPSSRFLFCTHLCASFPV
jgi:hypothetical protein